MARPVCIRTLSAPRRSGRALGHFTRMTDITPKSRLEGQRGYTIRTRSWDSIVEFYRDLISKSWPFLPMLRLVEAITTSSAAAQIHGATSHSALLLSDCADFRSGDSTLQIVYQPNDRTFAFHHRSFSSHDDQKTCTEAEALQTLRLFLRLKYGVLFDATMAQPCAPPNGGPAEPSGNSGVTGGPPSVS